MVARPHGGVTLGLDTGVGAAGAKNALVLMLEQLAKISPSRKVSAFSAELRGGSF